MVEKESVVSLILKLQIGTYFLYGCTFLEHFYTYTVYSLKNLYTFTVQRLFVYTFLLYKQLNSTHRKSIKISKTIVNV